MNVERLQALSARLRLLRPEQFDMSGFWFVHRNCGCTIGWAERMPEFNVLGFGVEQVGKIDEFREFFCLSHYQQESITDSELRLLPNEVADRIDAMIATERARAAAVAATERAAHLARLLPMVIERETV